MRLQNVQQKTTQNVLHQIRSLMKKKRIGPNKLNQIRREVATELRTIEIESEKEGMETSNMDDETPERKEEAKDDENV